MSYGRKWELASIQRGVICTNTLLCVADHEKEQGQLELPEPLPSPRSLFRTVNQLAVRQDSWPPEAPDGEPKLLRHPEPPHIQDSDAEGYEADNTDEEHGDEHSKQDDEACDNAVIWTKWVLGAA